MKPAWEKVTSFWWGGRPRPRATPRSRSCLVLAALAVCLTCAATLRAATWQIEIPDSSGAARYSSMKIDRSGNLHVVYSQEDGNTYPLRYAFRDHATGKWFTMTIAQGAAACSLALDSAQRPHVSYVDYGTGSGARLRYLNWDGSAWKGQPIPLNSDVIAYYNSIVLDAQDRPAISFYEYRGPKDSEIRIRLRAVMWNGKYWEARTVDSEEGSGKFNAMAIDPSGHIHLAYANVSAGTAGIRYAYWDGRAWKAQVIEGLEQNKGGTVGYSANIALDSSGRPRITYTDMTGMLIKYAALENDRWQIHAVDRIGAAAYPDRNAIAVDDRGRAWVGYYDAGRGQLKVARQEGGRWMADVVDGGGAGFASSLALEGNAVWISYGDEATHSLKVARLSLPAETSRVGR
jgi:hypothetical protein